MANHILNDNCICFAFTINISFAKFYCYQIAIIYKFEITAGHPPIFDLGFIQAVLFEKLLRKIDKCFIVLMAAFTYANNAVG